MLLDQILYELFFLMATSMMASLISSNLEIPSKHFMHRAILLRGVLAIGLFAIMNPIPLHSQTLVPMSLDGLYQLDRIADPQLSPDGRRVVYQVTRILDAAKNQIAYQCHLRGCSASACRSLQLDAKARLSDSRLREQSGELVYFCMLANSTGRFAHAIRFSDLADKTTPMPEWPLSRVAVWAHLGQWERARAQLNDIDIQRIVAEPPYLLGYLFFRRLLDPQQGLDPLPVMRDAIDQALKEGIGGISCQLLEWEVSLLSLSPHERVAAGLRLLQDMIDSRMTPRRLTRLRLEIAEAHAQAGSAEGKVLTLEAARELRRGRSPMMLYVPEGLVRCAKLLKPTDPQEAAALLHVARRWVRQALPHVPDFARESFIHEVPVNRVLLSEES